MKSPKPEITLQILNRDIATLYLNRPWQNETLYHRLIFLYRIEAASILENMKESVTAQDTEKLQDQAQK